LLIHRQEASFLGVPLARYIDIEDSEAILRAIRLRPTRMPIDPIVHTPGGPVPETELSQVRKRFLEGRPGLMTLIGVAVRQALAATRAAPWRQSQDALAQALAASLVGACPDGVWLVELGPLEDPVLVPVAVAAVIGLDEQPGRVPTDAIVDAVASRDMRARPRQLRAPGGYVCNLVGALLAGRARLRIQVTSRQPLRVRG
jgi:hypothetical protein